MEGSARDEERIFDAASGLTDPEVRLAFVAAACEGHPDLRRRVEGLLAASEQAETFFRESEVLVARSSTELTIAERPGDVIGRYRLLEKIGEGGCGTVYLAEQLELVRRRVALKIIKLGMNTAEVVARFEGERQALAMMDHPGIAKVFDGGVTGTGRPYFVMDWVQGTSLVRYCDEHRLGTDERLRLFVDVCHAVQHAHQKGIIHRDLKPSNILVAAGHGEPVPKVIDFGIAKAVEGRLTDDTFFTATNQFMGTPAYMSPEQASLSTMDVDTRSDIYSLGVLLYELLAGKTPFDTRELLAAGIDLLRQAIRETEPLRPSTRLQRLSAKELVAMSQHRGTEASRLVQSLRGDLDWIVMKCLEKDRARRYETANGLAMDVLRHLNGEPVLARPPTAGYRLRKFVGRNPVWVGAVTAMLLLATAAGAWIFREAVRANHAERREGELRILAESAQARAEAQERVARQQAYASAMLLAYDAWHAQDFGTTHEILRKYSGISTNHRTPTATAPWEWRHLRHETRDRYSRLWAQCSTSVYALAISVDQRWLAAGTKSGAILVWNRETEERIYQTNLQERITTMSFSPGGLLAVGSVKGVVRVLGVPSGSSVGRFISPIRDGIPNDDGRVILSTRFSGDGRQLAYAWEGGSSRVEPNGTVLESKTHGRPAARVSWSPDLSVCARLLYPMGFEIIQPSLTAWHPDHLGNKNDMVLGEVFSPDGRCVALPQDDGSIVLWSMDVRRPVARLIGHTRTADALAWSPDGRFLASGSADETIRVWDLRRKSTMRVLHGHEGSVNAVEFLSDGSGLFSAGGDGTIRLWRGWGSDPPGNSVPMPSNLADGHIAQGGRYASANVPTLGLMIVRGSPAPAVDQYMTLPGTVSTDGRSVLIASGAPISTNELRIYRRWQGGYALERVERIFASAFTPRISADGGRVAIASAEGDLGVWQISPWSQLALWRQVSGYFQHLTFDSTGNRVLGIGNDGTPFCGDIEAGSVTPIPYISGAGFIAASADGRRVAVAGARAVAVWDLERGGPPRLWRSLAIGNVPSKSVAFSPGGDRLAVGLWDGRIQIWDAEAELKVGILRGHTQMVLDLRFDPEDETLVSMGGDSLRVWRVQDAKSNGADEPVAVEPTGSPWAPFFLLPPESRRCLVGDGLLLDAAVQGESPLNYQWWRNGLPVPGATNHRLWITPTESATYALVVSNRFGSETSPGARVRVHRPIAGLHGTGNGKDGQVLEGGLLDPGYAVLRSVGEPGPVQARVADAEFSLMASGNWLANNAASKWIVPPEPPGECIQGIYTFVLNFELEGSDPGSAFLEGRWTSSHYSSEILLNGNRLPVAPRASPLYLLPFAITNGFRPGLNRLEFKVPSFGPGWIGLRVEGLRGGADPHGG